MGGASQIRLNGRPLLWLLSLSGYREHDDDTRRHDCRSRRRGVFLLRRRLQRNGPVKVRTIGMAGEGEVPPSPRAHPGASSRPLGHENRQHQASDCVQQSWCRPLCRWTDLVGGEDVGDWREFLAPGWMKLVDDQCHAGPRRAARSDQAMRRESLAAKPSSAQSSTSITRSPVLDDCICRRKTARKTCSSPR